MRYAINFTIPQGPTGPTGPTKLAAYGGIYNNTATQFDVDARASMIVPLPETMPGLNVDYTTTDSVIVNETGVYEINYYCNLTTSVATTVTLAIQKNGTSLFENVLKSALNNDFTFNGSVIESLDANSVIDMFLSTSSSIVTIELRDGLNSSLTLKKLN